MTFRTTQKISEALDVRAGKVAADGDAGVDTPWLDMESVNRIAFYVQTVDGQEVDSVQLREATDDGGAGAQDLGDAVTIGAQTGVVEIEVSDLSSGFTHVRANASTTGAHPVGVTPVAVGSYRP